MSYSLCCISNSLAKKGHKFQTMTWHRFSQLDREEAVATVSARTLNNIRVTYKILQRCAAKGWGYRVSSNLFPLLTYDVAELKIEEYPDWIDIQAALEDCASIIKYNGIRISCHPDQFNVLASEGKHNVAKTIKELNHHGWLMDMLAVIAITVALSTFMSTTPKANHKKSLTVLCLISESAINLFALALL